MMSRQRSALVSSEFVVWFGLRSETYLPFSVFTILPHKHQFNGLKRVTSLNKADLWLTILKNSHNNFEKIDVVKSWLGNQLLYGK